MSPNLEPTVIAGQKISLRHVGPRADVWPTSPAADITVLGRNDMVARPLPSAEVPGSPDWVTVSYTLRLDDAGEATLIFPNACASDGVMWRERFKADGHCQFLEIYDNGELDFVGVIDKVNVDPQQVQVHAYDGWWLLKKAYVRDWTVVQSPRDVIERGTMLWVPTVVDNFPAGTLNSQWTSTLTRTASVTISPSGGCILATTAGASSSQTQIASPVIAVPTTGSWRAAVALLTSTLSGVANAVSMTILESSGNAYIVQLYQGQAQFYAPSGAQIGQVTAPQAPVYNLAMESDGEWVSAFVNGQLIGQMRRASATTTSVQTQLGTTSFPGGSSLSVMLLGTLTDAQHPFLQRGSGKGDYTLPGTGSTYPSGGPHARYFNDLDLQSDLR